MASKINSRFVIVVAVVIAVLGVGTGAAYMLLIRNDPGRHLAAAERHLEDGDYRRAHRSFGKAYKNTKDAQLRLDILQKMEDTILRITPRSSAEAIDWTRTLHSYWAQTLILDRGNDEAAEKQLGEQYELASLSPAIEYWDRLYSVSGEILSFAPDHKTAQLYRGIAAAFRADRLGLSEDDRTKAAEALDRAAASNPDSGEVAYYRALMHLVESERAKELGEAEKAAEHNAAAFEYIDNFLADHPDNLDAWLGRVRLVQRGGPEAIEEKRKQGLAALTHAERLLADGGDLRKTVEVATLLIGFDDKMIDVEGEDEPVRSGFVRAERLLRAALAKHPDDPMPAFVLGTVLKQSGKPDQAVAMFQQAKKERPFRIGSRVKILQLTDFRAKAMKELTSIDLARAGRAENKQQREEILDRARQQVDELDTFVVENSLSHLGGLPLMLRGHLALIDGNPQKAQTLLSEANARYGGGSLEVLMLLSDALMRTGETGAAANFLSRAIAARGAGANPQLTMRLAQLYINTQQFDEARKVLSDLKDADPNNKQVLVLLSQVNYQASTSRIRDAITSGTGTTDDTTAELNDSIDESLTTLASGIASGDRSSVLLAAQLQMRAGRNEQARDLLADFIADNPTDALVLRQLVALEKQLGNNASAEAFIAKARAAEPDNPAWDLVSLNDPSDDVDAVLQAINQVEDPVDRNIQLFTWYKRTGEEEKAEQALAAAAAASPNDFRVVSAQLQKLLIAKQFDEAAALVERVESQDDDATGTSTTLWRTRIYEVRFADAVQNEDWEKAEKVVDEVAQSNDGQGLDYAEGNLWKGRLHLVRNQFEQAVNVLEAARDALPHSSQVRFELARARYAMGDLAGAEEDLRESLERKPENVSALVMLYQVHDRLRRHDEALTDLRTALKFAPRNPQLNAIYLNYLGQYGDREYAIQLREQIANRVPDDRGNRLSLASLYAEEGLNAKAGDLLRALIAEKPDDLAAIQAMARLELRTDKAEQGKKRLRDHVVSLGDEATLNDWLVLARFMRQAADGPAAEAAYRRAITLEDPTTRVATIELADWYMSIRRFADAAEQFEAALSTLEADNDARAALERRRAESLLNEGKYEQADTVITKLIENDPEDVLNVLVQARIAEVRLANETDLSETERDNRNNEIDAAYDRAVSLSRTNPVPYIQRARRHFNSEIPTLQSQVREDLLRAVELNPGAAEPRQMLASWYARRGDPIKASDELRRLIAARPDFLAARMTLIQLLLRDDRLGDAEQELIEAIASYPDQAVWYQMRSMLNLMGGDTTKWADDLGRAYRLDPRLPLFIEYGRALLTTGRHVELETLLRERPEELQTSPVLQAMRAHALAVSGQQGQAVNAFRRALDLSGSNVEVLDVVASHMRMSLPIDAQVQLLSERVKPDEPAVPVLILQVRLAAGQADQVRAEAQRMLPTVDADSPAAIELNRLLAQTQYIAGNYAESRKHYERVLEMVETDALSLNNLAYMLAKQFDEAETALPLAQRAVRQSALRVSVSAVTQRANVLDTLGYVQYRLDDLTAAEQTLMRSIRLRPLAANYAHLSQVLARLGRASDAREALVKAKQLMNDETGSEVREVIESLERSLEQTAVSAER